MGWELDELEEAAHLVAAEGENQASTEESSSDERETSSSSTSGDSEPDSSSEGGTNAPNDSSITKSVATAGHNTQPAENSTTNTTTKSSPFVRDPGVRPEECVTAALVNQSQASCIGLPSPHSVAVTGAAESGSEGTTTLYSEPDQATEYGTTQSRSPQNHNSSTTEGSKGGVVEELSEGLRNLLTLHPPATQPPSEPTTPSSASKKLIEELN